MSMMRRINEPSVPRNELRLNIGAHLRTARMSRSLTLDQVAQASGLSKSYVSRLERNEVSPSVASLVTLCDILGVKVGSLFESAEVVVVRAGEGRMLSIGGEGITDHLISGPNERLGFIEAVVEPGGFGGEALYSTDSDIQCAYVVRGTVVIQVEEERYTITAGDAITFPGRRPHNVFNETSERAVIVWAVSPLN